MKDRKGKKRLAVDILNNIHIQLREYAYHENTTITNLINEAISMLIESRRSKK